MSTFIPLPSDPKVRLTPEQRRALATVIDLRPLVEGMPATHTEYKPLRLAIPETAQHGR